MALGAKHVQTALGDNRTLDDIRAAIVNPARLHPERRDAVCFQCHLLPAVALIGVRRFDRPDYSFRPGEALTDYLLHVDIEDPEMPQEDRFEINHHAYRLRQSACFQKSEGALTCISCHNPHRKVPEEERIAHYSTVCLSCHETHSPEAPSTEVAPVDCVGCHMPQRRTQDVVQVIMTDHNIQRQAPPLAERLAPRRETEPILEGLDFLMPEHAPSGVSGDIYKTVTLLRTAATPDHVDRLEELLFLAPSDDPRPYFDLAQAQIKVRRYGAAEQTLHVLLEHNPDHPKLLQWMGIAHMGQNELPEAEDRFNQTLALNPAQAEVQFNLGLLLTREKRYAEAAERFRDALALRPTMSMAWFYLAEVATRQERLAEAAEYHRRALEIDPANTRVYLSLAQVFIQQGNQDEARRFLKHGLTMAQQPAALVQALADLPD